MTAPHEHTPVLVIDDEAAIRGGLARYLTTSGYQAVEAASGEDALAHLHETRFAAALCDIRMSGLSGIEFLSRALAVDPDLAVIMLTGVGDPKTAIQCLRQGAVDYLIKPVELEELGLALAYALRKRQLEVDRRGVEQWLAAEVARKTRQLEEQQRKVEQLTLSVLGALVSALEPVGPTGRTHSVRVAQLARHVGVTLGLAGDQLAAVEVAGRIHDIGRLALRDELLRQAAATEIAGGKQEGELALRLLNQLRHHEPVLAIVRTQHERWDGRGPHGLRGDAVPVGARILAAANLYDELVAPAEGDAGLAPPAALANLAGLAGTLLDPAVLDALRTVVAGAPGAGR